MRIVCQKCSAAYAIDDKFVTARGIRAQCPRCRHLQLVKKDDVHEAVTAPAPAAQPAPQLFDLGKPGSAAPAPATSPTSFSFDFSPLPPAPAGGAVAPAPAAFDFSALGATTQQVPPAPLQPPAPSAPGAAAVSPFDFGASSGTGATAASQFTFPAPGQSFDFGAGTSPAPPMPSAPTPAFPGADPAAAGPDKSAFDFGSPVGPPAPVPSAPPAPPPTSVAAEATCRSCGKALTDPFDQALGTCDDCRSKQQSQPGSAPDSQAGRVEHVDGAAKMKAPIFAPPASASKAVVRSALRDSFREGRGKLVAGVLVGVVVIAVGAVVLLDKKPWGPRQTKRIVTGPPPTPKAIENLVKQWKLNYPELEGEGASQAAGHLEAGDEHLLRDTTKGYVDAIDEFQKALVLDPSSDRAIAGWALALAFARNGPLDEQLAQSAEAMLDAAELRSGEPRLYVAHAHFLIARGSNANDIQVMADRGKKSPSARDKALAHLAIGEVLLAKNPAMAEAAFNEALKLDPKLKRAYLFQAQLAETLGRYRTGIEALEKRLSLDPDQWEASLHLARLYVEVGELAKAKRALEAARTASPRNARPKLALAVLSYQHAGELGSAIEQLNALVADKDLHRPDRVEAYVHLAIAHRLTGDLTRATDAVDRAQEHGPDSVAAKLQHFIIMLDKGVNSQARLDIDGLKGKLGNAALESTLEGRLLLAEGRFDDASALLARAAASDPRRADAILLAGAAAARGRRDGKAWELCLKNGIKSDPYSRPVPAMTQLYVRPADLLKPAVGAYKSLTTGSEEDPNPVLCEALVAWFSEDYRAAEAGFNRVNAIDPKNAEAYAYRAFAALRRRDLNTAGVLAARGVGASRSSALAHFAQAQVFLLAGKADTAKTEALAAEKYGASLAGPKVITADVEARLKNADEARRILTGVLLADPTYREAKRVLYKQGL